MIIAVDGPSAAGKGTIARAIAAKLGFHFLDTGSLYRMVGLQVLRDRKSAEDKDHAVSVAKSLDPTKYFDGDLRSEKVAAITSEIAQIPELRSVLLEFQREFSKRLPGAVLDGRDIGTVVCPDAEVKLFITASPEVRTRRRYEELLGRGDQVRFADILADVHARDTRDAARTLVACDAIVIDTSNLSVDQGVSKALSVVRTRIPV